MPDPRSAGDDRGDVVGPVVPTALGDPVLVVLIGASGAGKTTWATTHYRSGEVVSSDALRAATGTGPADMAASTDAFAVLELIVTARLARRLTTVIDTVGQEPVRRRSWVDRAHAAGIPVVAVIMDTDPRLCAERNRSRDRRVPAAVLTQQLRRMREVDAELAGEGWDRVVRVVSRVDSAADAATRGANQSAEPASAPPDATGPRLILQLSRFPVTDDLAGWLTSMARAADQAGFAGLALMDHLIQIPQVGRAWDPIPEPWVTLGLIAGLDTQLHLGTLVTPVTFRQPGIIAKAGATLSALAGGRTFCGIGAGWWPREHAAYGLELPDARTRLDQLERSIMIMRALWAPGTRAYRTPEAGGIDLPETTCYPRPTGSIPIIVGGNGERRTLKVAAAHADACNLPSVPDVLAHKVAVLHQHCAAIGRDPAEVKITVLDLPVLGADRDQVGRRIERLRGRLGAEAYVRSHPAGTAAQQIVRYRELAELGVSTAFVSPADLTGPDDLTGWASVIEGLR